jgi:hypothetical protein
VVHQAQAPGEPPTRVVNVIDGRHKSLGLGCGRRYAPWIMRCDLLASKKTVECRTDLSGQFGIG